MGGNYFELGFGPALPAVDKYEHKVVFKVQVPPDLSIGVIKRYKETYEEENCKTFQLSKEGPISIIEIPVEESRDMEIELTAVSASGLSDGILAYWSPNTKGHNKPGCRRSMRTVIPGTANVANISPAN